MNVSLLEPLFQSIESDRDAFFQQGLPRFAYFSGHVQGYLRGVDWVSSSHHFEGVTRPNFSTFVGRHFNELRGEHRWSAGHGVWTILRGEFSDDNEAVDAFIALARDYWSKHSGQTRPA